MSITSTSGLQSRSSTAIPLAAAAGFLFSARFALTFALVRGFHANEQIGSVLSLALSFLLLVLVVLDRLCASEDSVAPLVLPKPSRWALLYLAFIGFSLAWSASASLPASIAYWGGTTADVVTAVLLFRSADARAVAAAMMKGFVVASCVIALLAWIMPAEYDLRLGDQDYLNANTIANLSAFGFFFAQYLARVTPAGWTLASGFLSLTVLRSLSKTTTAAFVIGAVLLFIADRSMRRRTKLLLAGVAILAVLSLWGLFEAYYDLYTTTGNQAETLTGRTAIWAYVSDAIPERLLFGHGFDSMWKVVPAFGAFQARHAENEVLQQLYAYGVTGLTLAVAVYGSLLRQIRRLGASPACLPVICLLAYILVRGLAEAEPFDLLLPLWAVVLCSYAIQVQPSRSTAPQRAPPIHGPAVPSAAPALRGWHLSFVIAL